MTTAHCTLDTKFTNAHSEYVILIALPLQQWLYERVSLLCHKYIACLVINVWELRITKFEKFLN